MQYFVLLDVGLAHDISSDLLESVSYDKDPGQVGATFYGPLFEQASSTPLWVENDTGWVTIVCLGECYNTAWGRSGGPSPQRRAILAEERAARESNCLRDKRAAARLSDRL